MLGLAQTACIAAEERTICVNEDAIAENSDQFLPGYSLFEVPLENLDKSRYPFAHFDISYSSTDGIAHLQSRDFKHSPIPEAQTNLRQLVPWSDRTSFYKTDSGWSKLTLEDSKKIFGEPHVHGIGKIVFLTFDAPAMVQHEKQLFHLDMKFNSAGTIQSYRIRGIGIRNPQWVSD